MTKLLRLAILIFAAACGGSSTVDEPAGQLAGSEDELSRSIMSGVVAIGLERGPAADVKIIGAKDKVRKVMNAFRSGGPRTARCAVRSETRLTLWDKSGDEFGEAVLDCFKGTLTLTDGRTKEVSIAPSDLDTFDEPPVVGDSLWAIDKIQIAKRGLRAKTITGEDSIARVVSAFEPKQGIDRAVSPRCLHQRSISFFRRGREVASATYACTAEAAALEHAPAHYDFVGRTSDPQEPRGLIFIDSRRVEELF